MPREPIIDIAMTGVTVGHWGNTMKKQRVNRLSISLAPSILRDLDAMVEHRRNSGTGEFDFSLTHLITRHVTKRLSIDPNLGYASVGVNGGIRCRLNEDLTLNAAVGTRLAGELPEITVTVGFTWVF